MYRNVTNMVEVREYLDRQPVIAFDVETAPLNSYRLVERAALDPHKAQIVGISFSVAEGSGIYIPLAHRNGENADTIEFVNLLTEFAADPNIVKVAHNLAFESMFFYAWGIVIQPPVYDTIAAAQLTLKSNTGFRTLSDSGLKTLVPKLIGDTLLSFEQVTRGRHFDHLDPTDAVWKQMGVFNTTEGNVVDYDFIVAFIEKLSKRFLIREIAYDRYGAEKIRRDLEELGAENGFTVFPFGQGYLSMSPPSKDLYQFVMEGKIRHGKHPVLDWNMRNLIVETDAAGNIKPSKRKSTEKIDGAVAMVMGFARASVGGGIQQSIYDKRGLIGI